MKKFFDWFKNYIPFWKAALIRAFRTALQVLLSMYTVGQIISKEDAAQMFKVAIAAALYSIATSLLTGLPETSELNGDLILDESENGDTLRLVVNDDLETLKQKERITFTIKKE